MKMLFFSDDYSEVDQAGKELQAVGIACEIHNAPGGVVLPLVPLCAELWIHDNKDSQRALIRCAEVGVGFYKRPSRATPEDGLDWEMPSSEAAAREAAEAAAA
jgi:hypothetical protein